MSKRVEGAEFKVIALAEGYLVQQIEPPSRGNQQGGMTSAARVQITDVIDDLKAWLAGTSELVVAELQLPPREN